MFVGMGANSGGDYNLESSLRFRRSASANLTYQNKTATDRTAWTYSVWVKRSTTGVYDTLFAFRTAGTAYSELWFTSNDNLRFSEYNSAFIGELTSTAVYRDPSAWYHIVFVWDSANATSTDRCRLYVNGERITSFSATGFPAQNTLTLSSTPNQEFVIGRENYSPQFPFDGYMTEIHSVDGQALTADDFGEYDTTTGVWKPKEYTGTYGTNGFYLPMKETQQATGFNTVLWAGNGTSQSITGVGFEPDLVWIKNRSFANSHQFVDSVRGATKHVFSNTTDQEFTYANGLTSFNTDGFSIGNLNDVNNASYNYVAWCWDAGSSTVSNTDGTITSTVRANPATGFSVVTYTATGNGNDTVGHGLGTAPKVVLLKSRSTTGDWIYYTTQIDGSLDYLYLNQTAAKADSGWTAPSSTVFPPSNTANGTTMVAYCFSEVAGYSKFGTYTGNGSTSGPTITTGFRPAFVMMKSTDSTGNWIMFDNTRDVDDFISTSLAPNTVAVEFVGSSSNSAVTFTDTGFQLVGSGSVANASGVNFIYMAFADTRDAQFNFDASGNKNNWTPNNINSNASSETTYDIMNDVPTLTDEDTGNFCTLNPLDVSYPNNVYSNGNLDVSWTNTGSGISGSAFGSIGVNTGKWVFEATVSSYTGSSTLSIGWYGTSYLTRITPSANGVYTVAIDFDNQLAWFATNGTWTGDPEAGTGGTSITVDTSIPYFPLVRDNSGTVGNGAYFAVNFGQRPFAYTPPTGYKKLNTYNLPDSSIKDGSQYMNPVLYTGNGTSQSITGLGFSPDLVWVKSRNTASYWHNLVDTVRGNTKYLFSNDTTGETTQTTYLTSFDSDGFSIGSNANWNNSGTTYVAWNWRGSDSTAVSNTDGTITSTVSANTTSGFSVVTYTGNATAGATIGHGLGSAPDMIIIKDRDTVDNWAVYHSSLGGGNASLFLESTTTVNTSLNMWNSTAPSSSVITLGDRDEVNRATAHVAYCFADVEGFSKFGSYTGNGSTDGPFVYTGFRPAFILVKRTDAAGYDWFIYDTNRDTYNVASNYLRPNLSNAEAIGATYDILSNGFKNRSNFLAINESGGTYIYMAFAENPFKNSLAR